jgi:chitinase
MSSSLHRAGALVALALLALAAPAVRAATYSSIKASANGSYVCAENSGADPLVANRTAVGTWEEFQVVNNADGTVSFLSAISGKYVSADLNIGAKLIANRTAIDAWEKFRLMAQSNGTVALQAVANGLYVSADLNVGGVLVADRSVAQGWEQFTITPVGTAPPPPPTGGNFPARFTAPYVETWNNTSVSGLASSTGNKFYTLAFVIANATGGCTATWNGWDQLSSNLYVSDVAALRAQGGDVIVSFGGASGTELGLACTSVSALQAAYQAVITRYNLTWIDLDIEGAAISWQANSASIDRRNKAIKALQAANPSLRVSYTLPVSPSGLEPDGVSLLQNALQNGVRVDVVNVMAMDYGSCGIDMGQAAINAASGTRSQLSSIGMSAHVGVTPMIGVNDTTCENFTTANAQALVTYAQANGYISLLAYWAIGADSGFHYLDLLKSFH